MKQIYLKFSMLLLCMVMGLSAWAEDVTWNFTASKTVTGTTSYSLPITSVSPETETGTWTATSSSTFNVNTATTGVQFASAKAQFNGDITLSGSAIPSNASITGITVTCYTKSNDTYTLTAKVGGSAFGSSGTTTSSTGSKTVSFTGSATGNNIVISASTSTNAYLNVSAIKVTYSTGESTPTVLSTPTNLTSSSITSTSATLNWDAVENASSYKVKIGETEYDAKTNTYSTTALTASTEYTWSVMAIGDGTTYTSSDYSETATFTTPAAPAEVASLPFSFDGGKVDADNTDGMSKKGLGNDYGTSPKLKFDDTDDYLIIHYGEAAAELKYTIKGNSFSDGTFDVMESANGTDYTTVKSYTELSDATTETYTLNSASRYVKFVYTSKSAGNVALGAISITVAEEPEPKQTVALVAKYGDKYYAMAHDFSPVEVTISDGKAHVIEPWKSNITWNMATTDDGTAFTYNGQYLTGPKGTTLNLSGDEFYWIYDTENKAWKVTIGSTDRSFIYRESANAFKNYAITNAEDDGYSALAQAYEIVGEPSISRSTTTSKYGTICLPANATVEGAKIYSASLNAAKDEVLLTEVTDGMVAGTPYIYQATADAQTFTFGTEIASAPLTAGPLTGVFTTTTVPEGCYVLQTQDDEQMFYKVEGTLNLSAFKAYLTISDNNVKALNIVYSGEETAIDAVNALVSGEAKIYDMSGRRLSQLQKGVNIVNGVKVLVK